MSFMPCMFVVNELQTLDSEELFSYLLLRFRKKDRNPIVTFRQPCSSMFQYPHVYDAPCYTVALPSLLPSMELIRANASTV